MLARALFVALVAPAPAPAPPDCLGDKWDRAERLYGERKWDEAIAALEQTRACVDDPRLVWAQAQAENFRGNCQAAIPLYEQYLEMAPSGTEAAEAYDRIVECQEALAPPPPAPEPARPLAEPQGSADAPEPTRSVPWHRDPLGAALLGTGAVLVVGGATAFGVGVSSYLNSQDAPTQDAFEQQLDRSATLRTVGAAVFSVGGALIIGSVVRYALVRKNRRATASLGPSLAGIALSGRF